MESCHAEFRRATNPLHIFIEEEYIVEKDSMVDSNSLRDVYKIYWEEKGYKVLSDNNLGQELKRLGFDRIRKRVDGSRAYFYEGISLLSGIVSDKLLKGISPFSGGVPSCP